MNTDHRSRQCLQKEGLLLKLNYLQMCVANLWKRTREQRESRQAEGNSDNTAVPPAGIIRLTHGLDIGKVCSHPKAG